MDLNKISKRKLVIVGVATAILTLIIFLVYSHSFIEVTNESSDYINVKLINQTTESLQGELDIAPNETAKRLVKKGNYEVFTSTVTESSISIITTKPFLQTIQSIPKLAPENSRSFVGNNPGSCLYNTSEVYYSYSCFGTINLLSRHNKPRNSIPPYKSPYNGFLDGTIENTITIDKTTYLFNRTLPSHGEAEHTLHTLDEDMNSSFLYAMEELNGDQLYKFSTYRNGFLAHSSQVDSLTYYDVDGKDFSRIQIDIDPNQYQLSSVSGKDDVVAIAAIDTRSLQVIDVGLDEEDDSHEHDSKVQSLILIKFEEKEQFIKVKGFVNKILLCGDVGYLCIQTSDELVVFELRDNNAEELFRLTDVADFITNNQGLVVQRSNSILSLDIQSMKGKIDFQSVDYTLCGLYETTQNYAICIIDQKRNKHLLEVKDVALQGTAIESIYSSILTTPGIKEATMYGKTIYFSPSGVNPTTNSQTGNFDIDREKLQEIDKKVRERLSEKSISEPEFTIYNTLR